MHMYAVCMCLLPFEHVLVRVQPSFHVKRMSATRIPPTRWLDAAFFLCLSKNRFGVSHVQTHPMLKCVEHRSSVPTRLWCYPHSSDPISRLLTRSQPSRNVRICGYELFHVIGLFPHILVIGCDPSPPLHRAKRIKTIWSMPKRKSFKHAGQIGESSL